MTPKTSDETKDKPGEQVYADSKNKHKVKNSSAEHEQARIHFFSE
jgi:hypothetical protein